MMEATGYPMASIEKIMRLLELLRAINEDAFLSENLTLKGGTAINGDEVKVRAEALQAKGMYDWLGTDLHKKKYADFFDQYVFENCD